MISIYLILFLVRWDEIRKLELNLALLIAGIEYFLFIFQLILLYPINNVFESIIISLVYASYMVTTCYVDIVTGYVYRIFNLTVCLIFLILIIGKCINMSVFFTDFCILLFILIICKKKKAFGHGDVEFLMVVYCHLCLSSCFDSLILTLIIMLLSCFYFGIYEKVLGQKGGMTAFTPFISFSEYTILLICHFL